MPERPSSGAALCEQILTSEAKKFTDGERRLRVPEYYIAVTNVTLSSVEGSKPPRGKTTTGKPRRAPKGGQQKIDEFMKAAKGTLWTKDYAIWHADTLSSFLRSQEAIRRTYTCWLTSSDVLAEAMAQLQLRRPDFGDVITRFLARELWEDRWANLDHTGHAGDDQTLLANVFFDLPYALVGSGVPDDKRPKTLAAYLMERLRDKMDPETLALVSPDVSVSAEPNRFVLLGGPGQGKSTLGQFLAQLYRAALLKDRRGKLEAEKRRALDDFLKQCAASEIVLPDARRFPIRIELPLFANSIGSGGDASLLAYMAGHIGEVADAEIHIDDLREWLTRYPWVLVLDGLDEVPPSGNRAPVLKAIGRFWDEVAGCRADLAMVVTTRPQGFNDDLAPAYYNHVILSKLTTDQALAYSARLIERRLSNPRMRKTAMERLTAAAAKPTTARLMTSPLQVTIMAALVQGKGELPQDRWNLFKGYYEVIREREANKPESVARMLKEHGGVIEFIHQMAGLLLHIESERTGGADASMSLTRLKAMVAARLKSKEFSAEEAGALADRIVGDTMTRLVLLAGEKDGRVGFEVRSLQEFMAASALMNGSDRNKLARLEHIAGKGHWRHVFLFAAGRCFSDGDAEHLRDSVYRILEELDDVEDDHFLKLTCAGARLALELLEDANAANDPQAYCRLLRRALHLLAVDGAGFAARLVGVYRPCGEREMRQAIEHWLPQTSACEVWRLLFELNECAFAWSADILVERLPKAAERALALIAKTLPDNWAASNVVDWMKFAARKTVTNSAIAVYDKILMKHVSYDDFGDLEGLADIAFCAGASVCFAQIGATSQIINLSYILCDNEYIDCAAAFERDPSPSTLARYFQQLARLWPEREHDFIRVSLSSILPWIADTLSVSCNTGEELLVLADSVLRGEFGYLPDWLAAENRWRERGITLQDVEVLGNGIGVASDIGEVGVCLPSSYGHMGNYDGGGIRKYVDESLNLRTDISFFRIIGGLLFLANGRVDISEGVASRLMNLSEIYGSSWMVRFVLSGLPETLWGHPLTDVLCRIVGDANTEFYMDIDYCTKHFRAFPHRLILLVPIVAGRQEGESGLIDLAVPYMVGEQPAIVRAAFAVLCLQHGHLKRVNVAQLAHALLVLPILWAELVAEALRTPVAAGDPEAVNLALELARAGVQGLHSVLATAADQAQAEFGDKAMWEGLGLPVEFHAFAMAD